MTRKIFLFLVLAAAVGCAADTSTGPVTTVTHDPVIFVHGYGRTADDWNFMITHFKAAGWTDAELHTVSYGVLQSNVSVADLIKTKVDSILANTSATKVDIIAHSMGSLSSRYYIRNLGGDAKVDAWVSLGGPNHGTTTSDNCGLTPCLEMRQNSSFLTALNSGDETPGNVRYGTWWSPADQTILPNTSVLLTGASNTQTAGLGHLSLVSDLSVYTQVKSFIAP
jgi:triacylglycerol lipase